MIGEENIEPDAKRVRFSNNVETHKLPELESEVDETMKWAEVEKERIPDKENAETGKKEEEEDEWEMKLNAVSVVRFCFEPAGQGRSKDQPSSSSSSSSSSYDHAPLFTHQVYTNPTEHMGFKQSCAIDLRLHVHLCTRTLTTAAMQWVGHLDRGDRERLQAQTTRALPPMTERHTTSTSQALPVNPTAWAEVQQFSRGNAQEFVVYRATHRDAGATALLQSWEKLATWYIETADAVNFEDDAWEALFCFKRTTRADQNEEGGEGGCTYEYECAGYLTLYTFVNPIQGARIRICQALVLPHLQGQGLGRELVLCAYRLAASRSEVTQVTVESPCSEFARLRDRCDLEWALLRNAFPPALLLTCQEATLADVAKEGKDVSLGFSFDQGAVEATAVGALMTQAQAAFLHEAAVYASVIASARTQQETERAEAWKSHRLATKRRLLSAPENVELKGLRDKGALKKELQILYEEHVERVRSLLRASRRIRLDETD